MSHFNTCDFPQPQLRPTVPNTSDFPQPQLRSTILTVVKHSKPRLAISPPKLPPTAIPPATASSTVVYYSKPDATPPVQTPAPTISPVEIPPRPPLTAPPNSFQLTNQPYKNLLQEVMQKSNLPLPVYRTVNEGLQHAPKFRSTVCVNGVDITSQKTFWTRKEAEKFVAELGYKSIVENIIQEVPRDDSRLPKEVCSFFIKEKVICKSILHELAAKMKLEIPSYNTSQREGKLPIFVSSLVFNGVLYNGLPGKNKKVAEQLAAQAVVTSLLGDPMSEEVLSDIINAKRKVFGTSPNADDSNNNHPKVADNVVSGTEPIHGIKFEMPGSPLRVTILPGPDFSSSQKAAATELPIEFVPSNSSPQSVSGEASPLPSKKRRKNKKKSNKRLCLGDA